MSLHRQAEREIEELERQMEETDDPSERRELQQAICDIEREVDAYEQWEDEAYERGWR